MKRLLECVPNFSEGRDPERVDAIVAAMRAVPGCFSSIVKVTRTTTAA